MTDQTTPINYPEESSEDERNEDLDEEEEVPLEDDMDEIDAF